MESVSKEVTQRPTQWGNWRLNSDALTLDYHFEDGAIYDIALYECNNSAEILDWIFQIQGKKWADKDVMYCLLEAIYDILHPQSHFCSFGKHKEKDAKKAQKIVKLKEVQLSLGIQENEVAFKLNNARRFILTATKLRFASTGFAGE